MVNKGTAQLAPGATHHRGYYVTAICPEVTARKLLARWERNEKLAPIGWAVGGPVRAKRVALEVATELRTREVVSAMLDSPCAAQRFADAARKQGGVSDVQVEHRDWVIDPAGKKSLEKRERAST